MAFAKERLGGNLKGKKIAYLFYDNPAPARSRLPILEDLAKSEGFEMRTSRCRHLASRWAPRSRYHRPLQAGFHHHPPVRAIAIGFHQGAGRAFRSAKRVAFRVGSAEADIIARRGGMAVAEGYNGIQFAGVGKDFQVIKDIEAMCTRRRASPCRRRWTRPSTIIAAFIAAALHVEAVRNAIKAKGGRRRPGRGQERHGGHQGFHLAAWCH